ncbi:hypothetical protein DASB73_024230 [Starmerella bacillaris]|uniref:Uncharacterized protein n=1 Tax=Starmerella bacillaris TaxID=1247836 RepID=A0AAV5RJD0_STABA|nr:hypothetical protein DASB73_024230 [Starmerella bacillaris]
MAILFRPDEEETGRLSIKKTRNGFEASVDRENRIENTYERKYRVTSNGSVIKRSQIDSLMDTVTPSMHEINTSDSFVELLPLNERRLIQVNIAALRNFNNTIKKQEVVTESAGHPKPDIFRMDEFDDEKWMFE